jgi:ubiquinone/menaquinone biosynthesis C-methylase UbiE
MSRDLGTDAFALRQRLDTHQRFARLEINDWILARTTPQKGEWVLDLGCGTGKQLLALAARVGPAGRAIGVDVSSDAATAARTAAAGAGFEQVEVRTGRMEDLETLLPEEARFPLVLACFSLYYAESPERVLQQMRARLVPGGRAFVCGPALENNAEFLAFVDSVVPRHAQTLRRDDSLRFMEEIAPPLFSRLFESVEENTFENPIEFPTEDDLVQYWRSYHLYSPAHERQFAEAARAHFAREGRFITRKVVRGVLLGVAP